MAKPWEKYGGAAPASGPVLGPPKPVDPYKAEDQQFQRQANQRAQEDQNRQIERDRLQNEKDRFALERDRTKLEATGGVETTESEKTAAFLTTRLTNAASAIKRATQKDPDAQAPGFIETGAGLFGETARGFAQSAPRQQVYAAQLDLIDAALTLGTGAAYTAEQKESIGRTLTPQLSDDEATIAEKRRRLLEYLEAGRVKSGAASAAIDQAVAAVNDMYGDNGPEPELIEVDIENSPETRAMVARLQERFPNYQSLETDDNGNIVGLVTADGEYVRLYKPDTDPSGPDGGGLLESFGAGVGDVVEGVGDTLGLVGNPLNAGINALFGTELSTDLGQTFRDATGLPEGNPIASAINKGGIGALTGTGIANAARPIATGAGRAVTNALAQQPTRQVVAGAGAGASAETANQLGAPVPVQIAAGLVGGLGAYGAANRIASTRSPNALAQAADRQGVQLLPADTGGATTRRLTGAAAQGPISAQPLTRGAQASQASFQQAGRRASSGQVLEPEDLGEGIADAGKRFTKETSQRGSALYTRAEKLAEGVSIKPTGAVRVIDDQIAELSAAKETNAPLIAALERFKADLGSNKGVRVSGMRDLRTAAQKGAYSEDLRSTPAKRVLGIVADAIGQEIDGGLQAAGRGNAAQAFKTADAYWRDRVEYIDNVLEPIIGKGKSGEQVLDAVERMAQGKGKGVKTLSRLMANVPKDEMADIQATIIDRMGKAAAGQQNAAGDAYSASTFLTNWSKMSTRGKAALFPNSEVRSNLNDLALIADSMKAAGKYQNTSNTAGGLVGQAILTGGVTAAGGVSGLVLGSGAQYISGKLLASPAFAKWLAKAPANPPQAYIKRLDTIAASNPIIANDIASVKQFLANAPTSSRAAASEDISEERPIPPQQ